MRKLIILALVVMVGAASGGVVLGQGNDQVLRVGWGVDVISLDPAGSTGFRPIGVMAMTLESLVTFDQDLEIVPALAESWEILDDTTYEFYLRRGVTFADGTEFTARAVKMSIDRFIDPEMAAPRAFLLNMVEEVEVIDDFTVRIHLNEPFGPFLRTLTFSPIISPTQLEKEGDEVLQKPIGTGPFFIDEWVQEELLVLTRFENYWGELPRLEQIRYRVIPDEATRLIELETGAIDFAVDVPAHEVERLREAPGVEVDLGPTVRVVHFAMNQEVEPFDNRLVRKALNYAVNTEAIVRVLFGEGTADAPTSVMSPFLLGGVEREHKYDPEKARELLAEAGYPDGFETEMWTGRGRYLNDVEVATAVASMLAQVGVDVDLQVWDWASYVSELATRDYAGLVMLGWGSVTGEPQSYLPNMFHTRHQFEVQNLANYSNPEVDRLIDEARVIADEEEREKIYKEAIDIIDNDYPWLLLYIPKAVVAYRDNVKGYYAHPLEILVLDTIYKTSP